MKRLSSTALLALLFAACSTTTNAADGGTSTGTGTTGSGSTTSGSGSTTGNGSATTGGVPVITVVVSSVDVFPPALAWLNKNNLPVQSVFDAGYELIVNGVHLDIVHGTATLTELGTLPLTPTTPAPPYTFIIDAGLMGVYDLGLVLAVAPIATSDAGTIEPQMVCGDIDHAIDAGAAALGPLYFDYFIPAGAQPGVALAPATAGTISGTIYALPASFVARLSCAAGISTADGGLLAGGIGLFYMTDGNYGVGNPVAGATISNSGNGQLYYYSNDFSSGSMTGPTDVTGVAAITAVVNPPPGLPPKMTLVPPTGGPMWAPARVQTNVGAVLEILPYVPAP